MGARHIRRNVRSAENPALRIDHSRLGARCRYDPSCSFTILSVPLLIDSTSPIDGVRLSAPFRQGEARSFVCVQRTLPDVHGTPPLDPREAAFLHARSGALTTVFAPVHDIPQFIIVTVCVKEFQQILKYFPLVGVPIVELANVTGIGYTTLYHYRNGLKPKEEKYR